MSDTLNSVSTVASRMEKQITEVASTISISNSNATILPLTVAENSILDEFDDEDRRRREATAQERCSKLLQNLGWGNGMKIPFADAENKKLEKDLEFKQRKILALRSEYTDNVDHAKALEVHLVRVKEDIHSYQILVNNKKSLVDEENTFVGLSERMLHRIIEDKGKLEKVIKGCQERSEAMQKEFVRRLRNITEIKELIDFDAAALRDYQRRIQEYEESSMDVKKLCMEDEKQIRELEVPRTELGARRKELRFQLDREATNTAKFQEQFDRLSIEFRKVHKQRQEMIGMWGATIQAMSSKDDDMKDIADEYYETKTLLRRLTDSMADKERRLRLESCGIRGKEMALSELDRRVDKFRRLLDEERTLLNQLKDSCALSKTEVHHAVNQTKTRMAEMFKLNKELQIFEFKYNRALTKVNELKAQLQEIMFQKSTAGNRTAELEKILNEEEAICDVLAKDMEVLRKYFWERTNDKAVTEEEIRNLETSILRVQNNLGIMQTKEALNSDFVAKRSGILYRLDLECSILENRISRMTNQSVDPKYFELQNTVIELRQSQKKIEKDKRYIASELDHVRGMTHKCNSETAKIRQDALTLEADLHQCDMLTHGLEKLMETSTKELHQEHVKHSLERVFLKRLTDELKSERRELFGLAEIRNTIHWAVRERKAEIENHRMLNSSRQKALSEAVSKLRVQVAEVTYRTEKLKGRYYLVTKLMSSSIDSNPDELTMGFQVRKAARERETLQIELQKWRMRLEEAEHELEGITNVHKIMKTSNVSLKESLSPAAEKSDEVRSLEEMNVEEQEILLRVNRAKKYRAILRDRVQDLDQQIAVMEQEVQATSQLNQMKEAMTSKVQNEIYRQKEKVNRWSGMCSRILKEIKGKIPEEGYNGLQLDLKLRFTSSKFETGVVMLEKVLSQYPYLRHFINHYLNKQMILLKVYYRLNKITHASALEKAPSSTYTPFSMTPTDNIADTTDPDDNSGEHDLAAKSSTTDSDSLSPVVSRKSIRKSRTSEIEKRSSSKSLSFMSLRMASVESVEKKASSTNGFFDPANESVENF